MRVGVYEDTKSSKYLDSDPLILAYNNYLNWEKSGGKELQLPGFFLTNHQMFWLVVAHLGYTKGHNQDMDPVHQLVLDFFHVIYKEKPEFREAYKCSKMTDEEQEVYEDMLEIRSYFG